MAGYVTGFIEMYIRQEATMLLQKQNGIAHLSMQVSGTKRDTLPTDPAQIHFLVFYEPAATGLTTQQKRATIPTI